MFAAVDVRPEVHTVLIYLPAIGEAEHLEAAAVRQDRPIPAGEFVEATAPGDQLIAGAEHQVIGIAKNNARADLL